MSAFGEVCAQYERCGAVSDVAECVKMLRAQLAPIIPEYEPFIEAGRLAVGDIEACAAQIQALSCTQPIPGPGEGACGRLFEGLVPEGGACSTYTGQNECVLGFYCRTDLTCPGTCTVRVAEGQSAPTESACLEGLYLYDGECRRPVEIAGSCAPVAPSVEPQACVSGAYCAPDQSCVSLPGLGASCATQNCADNYVCVGNTCIERFNVGASCDISTNRCDVDLVCAPIDGGGRACSLRGKTGAICESSAQCDFDLRCVGATGGDLGECAPRGTSGALCADSVDCQDGLACLVAPGSSGGLCRAPGGEGAACRNDGHCTDGLVCVSSGSDLGSCNVLGEPGDRCYFSPDCGEATRCDGSTNRCIARTAPDAACTVVDECVSTHFCRFDSGTSTSSCKPKIANGIACVGGDVCLDPSSSCNGATCAFAGGTCNDVF